MPTGFFSSSELVQHVPISTLPKCGACGLFKKCKSPKMPVSGSGKRGILLVGEAPGENEDYYGMQFCGASGRLLERYLAKCHIDMRRDCWLTNAIICRPKANARPTSKQIAYCRPNLVDSITRLNPKVIVLLGQVAVESMIPWVWKGCKEAELSIGRWIGWRIPCQRLNSWICPIWHPSFILRERENSAELPVIWSRHLEAIAGLHDRPWKSVPDYSKKIRLIMSVEEAAKAIDDIVASKPAMAAFDYETTTLKPEWPEARIISASICDGVRSIAFPFFTKGALADSFKRFLSSSIRKIASNIKFEDRWSVAVLKTSVSNWEWDTMNMAHLLDCRRGITGLKFQAFVRLGADSYNSKIEPFLSGVAGSRSNQLLKNVSMEDLLRYNAMDSLLEYDVAISQMQELGVRSLYGRK